MSTPHWARASRSAKGFNGFRGCDFGLTLGDALGKVPNRLSLHRFVTSSDRRRAPSVECRKPPAGLCAFVRFGRGDHEHVVLGPDRYRVSAGPQSGAANFREETCGRATDQPPPTKARSHEARPCRSVRVLADPRLRTWPFRADPPTRDAAPVDLAGWSVRVWQDESDQWVYLAGQAAASGC